MGKWLSLTKSSLHDIRCCDESASPVVGVDPTAWRALVSSVTCITGIDGFNTGYADVATLEQYNPITGIATGITKANLSSDPNYIADYISLGSCALHTADTTSGHLFARNYNSGILIINLEGIDGLPNYEFDVNSGATITQNIVAGDYLVVMHVGQTGAGMHVRMGINDLSALVDSDVMHTFDSVASDIDITTHPEFVP